MVYPDNIVLSRARALLASSLCVAHLQRQQRPGITGYTHCAVRVFKPKAARARTSTTVEVGNTEWVVEMNVPALQMTGRGAR